MTTESGSPFAPHTHEETTAMLEAIGASSEDDLFDIPAPIQFEGSFDIDAKAEQDVRTEIRRRLNQNDTLTEFLGRGHYHHYIPSLVDHLADRSEFLTSYTQYQPEIAQGFLQALFEYQSILVELTGLGIANCSLYDGATALAEAALLAGRVETGDRILIPDILREERRQVLENYAAGPGFTVETYATDDANVSPTSLIDAIDDETLMVYVESPNDRGAIEEHLSNTSSIAHDHDAVCCLGSDPVALALLEEPAAVGIDVVVGDAAALGLGTAYGMGLGLFACREDYLRRVPGRLVGVSEDTRDRRAYTLTLQTREQHIRRERATSNICTNQAWVALRTAIHAAVLGPDGLIDLAEDCVEFASELADRLDAITGVRAPIHDRHHFREFVAHTDQPAPALAEDLATEGYAAHVVGDHELQFCVTESNAHAVDGLVDAMERVT